MGSFRAESIIDIWFSVSMLIAGVYIVSHTHLCKFPQLVAALLQEPNHKSTTCQSQGSSAIDAKSFLLEASGCFSMLIV